MEHRGAAASTKRQDRVTESLFLLGLKHSGKTTHGRRLAGEIGFDFIDVDPVIEGCYRADRAVPCREIYARHGKRYFMDLETQAAQRIAAQASASPLVVSLGGGTGENPEATAMLRDLGWFVYLRDSEERLFERMTRTGLPAFLSSEAPEADFHRMFVRRDELYESICDLIVEIDGLDIEEAYSRLQSVVMEHIDGR